MFVAGSVDPLGDLAALPGAQVLIRDSLACPGAWLLPWVIKQYVAQGCKVRCEAVQAKNTVCVDTRRMAIDAAS